MDKILYMVLQHEIQGDFHVYEDPTSLMNVVHSQIFNRMVQSLLGKVTIVCVLIMVKTTTQLIIVMPSIDFLLISRGNLQITLPQMIKKWEFLHKLLMKNLHLHPLLLNNMTNCCNGYNNLS